MTGEYRTGARILTALADAPMNAEALMHELDINRRQLGLAVAHLVKQGRIEQDDRQCWSLVKPDAEPRPVVPQDPAVPAAPRRRVTDALDDLVAQLTTDRPTTSIALSDQVLQVLIAAGRITQDDIRLASTLIGRRA